jgi:hypothetical protein
LLRLFLGVLFVDGYILFLKGDVEYNQQGTGTLVDDKYTATVIPSLTTPGSFEFFVSIPITQNRLCNE